MADTMIYALPDGDPAVGTDMIPISRGATGGNFCVSASTVSAVGVAVEVTRAESAEAANATAIAAETARAEAAEASIVAGAGGGMTKIAEVILTGSQATIVFSSIPNTFRHLKIFITAKEDAGGGGMYIQFNGDTGANYSNEQTLSQDTSVASSRSGPTAIATIGLVGISTDPIANRAACNEITVYDYARAVWQKNAVGIGQRQDTSYYNWQAMVNWANTAAINAILLGVDDGGNFVTGTVATLYGF